MDKVHTIPNYRLLKETEFLLYREIWLECLKEHPDNFGPTYHEEANKTTLKFSHIFNDNNTGDFLCGAFIENELVGICGFISEKMIKTKHRGSISQMYVKNNFSHRGIGTGLLQSAIEKAFSDKTIEQITLTVVATNKEAIALYKKNGFTQYGILENCIKNEHEYVADLFLVLQQSDHFIYKNQLT